MGDISPDPQTYWYLIQAEAPYRSPLNLQVHPTPGETPQETLDRANLEASVIKDRGYRITNQGRTPIPKALGWGVTQNWD